MVRVEIEEAGARLEELVSLALEGHEVVILVGGVPQVRLEPINHVDAELPPIN